MLRALEEADKVMLPQPTYPTEQVESGWELILIVGGGVAAMIVFFLVWLLRDARENRRAEKQGRWPTAKVRQLDEHHWDWTCWYCEERSEEFTSLDAAEHSARHHTDHVER